MIRSFTVQIGVITAVIVIGVTALFFALVGPFGSYGRNAGGLSAYLGVTQAATMKGRQTMHGGTSAGAHEYHLQAAIYDTPNATRISDATVTAIVRGAGLPGQEAKLEPMNVANGISYGGFIHLPAVDIYTIELTVERAGSLKPVTLDFSYDHRRH